MSLEKQNHFQRLNLQTKFQIDEDELEIKYLKLQQQFHPDNSSNKTEDEINSALINQSYEILKNPIKRAIYLLQINGINIDDEESAPRPDHEVLMLIMEFREEILENKNEAQKIAAIKKNIKQMIADEMKIIIQLFDQDNYQEISQKLIKVKYLDKIIADLKQSF